jgi:hypothetical protein
MDSMDSMDSVDRNDTVEFGQPAEPTNEAGDPGGAPAQRRRWSGRTKRVVTSVAASAVLLGSGAGIGMALTGGASASTGNGSTGNGSTGAALTGASGTGTAAATAASAAVGRCARLEQRLRSNSHVTAANLVQAFCHRRLLRLALVGGEHGEVTFQTKAGPTTVAFERGTIQAVSSTVITVVAKDGTTWTWDLSSSTKYRDAHQQVTSDKLSSGELVLVVGTAVNGTHDARLVRIRPASGS